MSEKIDTSTAMGEFVFHILGAVAQLEREITRERTFPGLAVAAENGRRPGRIPALSPMQKCEISSLRAKAALSVPDLARRYGVSEMTIYRASS